MTASPLVSVIVPARTLTSRITDLRSQLERQSFRDWELIVNTEPPNPARGRNRGAAQAKGRWLVFLDDDVRLGHRHHLADLAAALERLGPHCAVGVPCRLAFGLSAFQRRFAREEFAERIPASRRLVEVAWRDAIDGRCLAIPRQTFEAVGGFDEQLVSAEDYELLYRLQSRGVKLYALTDSWVDYQPPPNLRVALKKAIWYGRGNAQVARKHPQARYGVPLRGRLHAAAYLALRTVSLLPLMLVKVSVQDRRMRPAWRPIAGLVSYVGAWAYCQRWFATADGHGPRIGKRVKLFFLITGIDMGGAETLLLGLTTRLDRTRFEPIVGTLVGGRMIPEFEAAGVRVHNFAMRHKLDLGAVWRLRRVLRQERPEILHTHLIHADVLGRLVGRWCRVPVVVSTVHMVEAIRYKWFWKTMDRWTSRLNDALTAVSEEVKRGVVAVEGLDPARIRVIPNGVEFPGAPDPAVRQRHRRQLRLTEDAWLVGIVAQLYAGPRKGHHVLFEAVRRLLPRWPTLHGVVIGDGPSRQSLEAQARALGIAERVRFVGLQRDIPAWLSALDLFVLPSLEEGAPIAVIEAMAAGCPIVATAVGGVPELITDHETGLLVPPGDVDALAEAIATLCADRVLAARLGQAAKERFHERYDLRQVVRRTEALYERLLAHRRGERLKVLEVSTSLDPGGVTTYLAGLVRSLPRAQFEVALASGVERFQADLVRQLDVPHYPVHLTKSIDPLKDVLALCELVRLIRRRRFDVVHTNMCKADLVGGLAARLCRVPLLISTAHGPTQLTVGPSRRQALFDRLEALVLQRLPHRVIGVSAATTRTLLAKQKVRPQQVVTIPNGLGPRDGRDSGARARVREALSLAPEQLVMAMVGRLQPPKTPEVLIEAMRRLRPVWSDAVCLIIGEGPQTPRLAALIDRHGLADAVRLLGHRDDVPGLLAACDLFVLSTSSEGMPMSVLEAMAEGLPIVASRVEGMEELVDHGRTGLLVPSSDALALAQAIDALLRDPERRRAMGNAARERCRSRFALARHVARTRDVLLSCVAG
ncbi:MAG: glycosyltransferase [Candidatus Omnitrophica bacterium]|nr:glycosyltransferase [Candidatus Omnitrophota bacterium]